MDLFPPLKSPLPLPPLKFTVEESAAAHRDWQATCGPHAVAAACEKTLEEVRRSIPNYRGWMNPTQVAAALKMLGVAYVLEKGLHTQVLPKKSGIARIQFEGPWLNPGVPAAAAYPHTHWIASKGGCVYCTMVPPKEWLREEL